MNGMNRMNRKTNYLSDKNLLQTLKSCLARNISGWMFMLPCILGLIIFTWYPMVQGVYMSFCKTKGYDIVEFTGLQNYIKILHNTVFLKALGNSFKYVFWCFVLGFGLPIILSILVNEIRKGQQTFRVLMYLPTMVPGIAASIIWAILLNPGPTGLFNTLLLKLGWGPLGWLEDAKLVIPTIAMTCTWSGFGATTIWYLSSLQSVDTSLYEAATIDGAGFWKRVWHITLPHLSPMIRLGIVSQIIGTFSIFQQVFVLTGGGPNNASMNLAMLSYNYAFVSMNMGTSAAVGVIQSLILMVISTVLYRKTDKGDIHG